MKDLRKEIIELAKQYGINCATVCMNELGHEKIRSYKEKTEKIFKKMETKLVLLEAEEHERGWNDCIGGP